MNDILRVDSISKLHELIGYEKPKHPLITIIDLTNIPPNKTPESQAVIHGFYTIILKNAEECNVKYGRKHYDFSEGSLMFMAPEQMFIADGEPTSPLIEGWMLCFHPDLIRASKLYEQMADYTFFSYEVNEALHLSEKEKEIITQIVKTIENEYSMNLDVYSLDLIISNLELLLNYSQRFYGRQFITRTHVNKAVVSRFEDVLKECFEPEFIENNGIPTVKYVAERLGYSANYLSDLIKKETGKNTQEHIHLYLIEKAKTMLLTTSDPIKEIAYTLGFEYPAHFSKFFKNKTGMSPKTFRN